MNADNELTFVGNLGGVPVRRYTSQGISVVNFRLASTRRLTRTDGSRDERTVWLDVTVWGDEADNVAGSDLSQGDRVVVLGELVDESYERSVDGEVVRIPKLGVKAREVAPSLRFARLRGQLVRQPSPGTKAVGRPTLPPSATEPGPFG